MYKKRGKGGGGSIDRLTLQTLAKSHATDDGHDESQNQGGERDRGEDGEGFPGDDVTIHLWSRHPHDSDLVPEVDLKRVAINRAGDGGRQSRGMSTRRRKSVEWVDLPSHPIRIT